MKDNEWQVVNRKLSEKLKKAGFKQEGLWCWNPGMTNNKVWWELLNLPTNYGSPKKPKKEVAIIAPTVAEMGEALPDWNYTIRLDYEPYKNKWCALQRGGRIEVEANTEANARAKMWLYLKKEGLL